MERHFDNTCQRPSSFLARVTRRNATRPTLIQKIRLQPSYPSVDMIWHAATALLSASLRHERSCGADIISRKCLKKQWRTISFFELQSSDLDKCTF